MKKYSTEQIRNVGLYGHQASGKTTLADSILYLTGGADRFHKVDDGNSLLDFDPEEVNRRMTIYAALAPVEWEGHKINVLDLPGFFDFQYEITASLRVVEGLVLLASAVAGVEVGLEKVWGQAELLGMPRIMFFNKMDKENADFYRCLDDCSEKLSGSRLVPIELPIGTADTFSGVVNLVSQKAYKFDDKGKPQEIPIPGDMNERIQTYREKLAEEAAEATEELMEKYLETMELSDEEMRDGLLRRIQSGQIVPVLCGSATQIRGVAPLLNAILRYVPNPLEGKSDPKVDPAGPFSGLVFKTTSDQYLGKLSYMKVFSGTLKPNGEYYNSTKERSEKVANIFTLRGKKQEPLEEAAAGDICLVAKLEGTRTGDTLCTKDKKTVIAPIKFARPYFVQAIHPKSKADEDKLSSKLADILAEDPTLQVERDDSIRQTLLKGVGDVQIDICVNRLKRAGVDVELEHPKVSYKETIRGTVKIQGRHKKQTGGRGQFADVWLELAPRARGEGYEFVDKIVGGVIPGNFRPSVDKGVQNAMKDGFLAGYPVVDMSVTLYDGSYHDVDSSDMAFQIAGAKAFKEGALKANPVLLEPITEVEVIIPESFMGDIMGDLNSKRGRILGMEPIGRGLQMVKANVPASEMLRYSIDLRSMTQGRGEFNMKFSHYEEAPPSVAEGVIAQAKAAAAAAE